MKMRLGGCVLLVPFCWFIIMLVADAHRTDPSEVSAIMAFKSKLVDPMKHLSSWNRGDPCSSNWNGVLCFNTTKADGYLHVRELQLMNMNLSGTLSPEISRLSQLQIFNVMWNDLTGSIPKEIGDIVPLRLLLLNGNKLSGALPTELGRLTNVNRIQIDQNHISGPIPESFSNLSSLRHVHFNNNSLSGGIPRQLSNLTNLLHLLLDNNNLTGHLPPELSKIRQLRILQLDNNNFTETEIPKSYGDLLTLVKLSIRNCSLHGAIPDLSRIRNLSFLDLSHNQLAGPIPSNHLSVNITTINLSSNKLNGSIPESFAGLPSLQELLLQNNVLTGYIPAKIWQNMSFSAQARLLLDLRHNSLTNILGDLTPPVNVTLRLEGNPICSTTNTSKLDKFCGPVAEGNDSIDNTKDSTDMCPIQACPAADNFEYIPASPVRCFCAAPIRIGFRLKSPSFSYFLPYVYPFERYFTSALNMDLYQLSIESYVWEKGPRLRMYLELFPMVNDVHSNTLNSSEVLRVKALITSWDPHLQNDFFGPYELLNFTLLGPYLYGNFESQRKSMSLGVLLAIILASITFAIIVSAVATICFGKKWYNVARRHISSKTFIKTKGVREFTFREMARATNSFNNSSQIGQGGYGVVYRGILPDGTIVAIKRAKEESLQGTKEFLTEIEMLSRAHHRNLVSLVGYCDQDEEQMLVYEFMSNGTLQDWLSAEFEEALNFSARLHIALDAAMGILYLHTEADPPIFHRDIKASNILLDTGLNAKVSDFGLSRLAPVLDDEGIMPNHVSTVVKGTPGYLDPEYLLTRKLTEKSDVYSLGVVFLEILTGRQPISRGKNIVREVNLALESGDVFDIMDSRMGPYPPERAERFLALALRCCQNKPEERPLVLDVVRELEDILQMMPKTMSDSSQSTSKYFSEPSSAPHVSSSTISGSDHSSGTTTTTTFPR